MLPKDLLEKFPTLNELLEHPRVRDAAASWSQSTMVARARGALDQLTNEIGRRTETWTDASPHDLFDRVLHLLDRPEVPQQTEVINATGRLGIDAGWKRSPLAEEVIAFAAQEATTFAPVRDAKEPCRAVVALQRLTKAESAAMASSYVTAHIAMLTVLSKQGRAMIVGRPDVGTVVPQHRLLTLCESQQVEVIEVGAAQQASWEDYEQAIEQIVAKTPGAPQPMVYLGPAVIEQLTNEGEAAFTDFVKRVHQHRSQVVVALADSAPVDLEAGLDQSYLSAASACNAGADLVLLRGDGIVGGPAVGLILGRSPLVESVAEVISGQHWQAAMTDARLMDVTLTLFEQPERLPFRHPVASLLDTPLENLRTRAERLAQLMEGADGLGDVVAVELTGRRVATGLKPVGSWGIQLTPSLEGDVASVSEKFRTATPSIVCESSGDKLLLDLRTVLPSQDSHMVYVLQGEDSVASETPAAG